MTDYKVMFSQVVAELDETHELHNHGDIMCVGAATRFIEGMDKVMAQKGVPSRTRKAMFEEFESGERLIAHRRKRHDGSLADEIQLLFRPVYYPSGAFFTASKGTKWLMKCGALEGSLLKVLMEMCETTSTWTYTEYTQKWRRGRKVEKRLKKMKRRGEKQTTKWVQQKERKCRGKRR